jgi:hypothetical protein
MSFENPLGSGGPDQPRSNTDQRENQASSEEIDSTISRARLRAEIAGDIESRLRRQNPNVYGPTYTDIEEIFVVRELVDPQDWPNASHSLKRYLQIALDAGYSLEDARAVYGELIRKYVAEFDIDRVEPE